MCEIIEENKEPSSFGYRWNIFRRMNDCRKNENFRAKIVA